MHDFLQTIGFQKVKSYQETYTILKEAETKFTRHNRIALETELDFCEFQKEYGTQIGLSVYGVMNPSEHFEREYYIPYFSGKGISSYADIIVERRMDREEYVGICEDPRVGASLIFHVQNTMEYLKTLKDGMLPQLNTSVTLSGLSNEGTILLPVMKDEAQEQTRKEESRNRMMLLSAAREGDAQAIESLTLDDIDIYSQVSRRLITEDVFSIVESYFMPYGVECDQYSIMGEIVEMQTIKNKKTKEELYALTLEVNEIIFDICIPKDKLNGEPAEGRRFKGNIWLQGFINF